MTEGVAEVQEHSFAGFVFVPFDDPRLDSHGLRDRMLQLRHRSAAQAVRAAEQGEERRTLQERALEDLVSTALLLPVRQGAQQRRVRKNEIRLVEGADQILAFHEVDSRLAADTAVDHREKSSGDLDERNAAGVRRGGEAGGVAHRASAEGDHDGTAIESGAREGAHHPLPLRSGFRRLPIAQDECRSRCEAAVAQRSIERGAMEVEDATRRNDHSRGRRAKSRPEMTRVENTRADDDVVRPRTRANPHPFHGAAAYQTAREPALSARAA